jgi:hypothetical protein
MIEHSFIAGIEVAHITHIRSGVSKALLAAAMICFASST